MAQGKILLLSQRAIADLVAYCIAYEFEDTFAAVTGAHRIDAIDFAGLEFSRRAYKLARLASGSARFARQVAPYPRKRVILDREFELFFPIFNHTYELYSLATIPNWRKCCRKAACFINEAWSDMLPGYLLELLSAFDHIFIASRHCVPHVARITGRPCTYLPLAVDVPRFTPASLDSRPIHVCNIGRRSPVTHQALLDEAGQHQSRFYYYYDTVAASGWDRKHRTFRVDSASEHRVMLATILKHSCYYIAHRSYVNRPEFTAGREEISSRFYEGAAAGTVMLGEAPRNAEFTRQFDWPGAIIPVPFDSPEIGRTLADFDADPERLREVRRNNAREAALRHDWLHRIHVVFDVLGLKTTEDMRARAQLLDGIACRLSAKQSKHPRIAE